MLHFSRFAALAIAPLLLSACVGTSIDTQIDTTAPSTLALLAHNNLSNEINGYSDTSTLSMPASGTAVFNGSAIMQLFTVPSNTSLVGDASLTATFLTDTLGGSMNNFVGTDRYGAESVYNGNLVISSGVIGANGANGFTADFSGGLTHTDNPTSSLVVNGSLTGKFKGTPIVGLSASGTTSLAVVNGSGTLQPGVVSIVATRQ